MSACQFVCGLQGELAIATATKAEATTNQSSEDKQKKHDEQGCETTKLQCMGGEDSIAGTQVQGIEGDNDDEKGEHKWGGQRPPARPST